ncbi:MAG: class I SAM-dependent methyltransferase [Bacteroidales bacterium]|nr:class I SAM-dependent methyltransferase [Bacteroidales bacterium]MDD4703728.1 class I SAM-dependent methyltransferase [Bacteroidales bacterium]
MKLLRRIFFPLWNISARFWVSKGIKEEKEPIRKVASALKSSLKKKLDIEEKLWRKNIEQLRQELKQNEQEIIVTDFGAGSPKVSRSPQEMNTGIVNSTTYSKVVKASKSPFWSLFLHKLIREFQPEKGLEFGTSLGLSAAYLASGMTINGKGKLITMEGSLSLVESAIKNFTKIGLINIETVQGRFADNLDKVLTENNPLDFVFIDAHHDKDATIGYFQTILPYLSENCIVVFDDIRWSRGMKKAFSLITENPRIRFVFDLKEMGVCILAPETTEKIVYKV